MESGCEQGNENIYFACRKRAAIYNERLNSRDEAAELLGISTSSLSNHELGITKNVPVDTVVMMADLYRAPELRNHYCKHECPIGKFLPISTVVDNIERVTVKLLSKMDTDGMEWMKTKLLNIAAKGKLDKEDHCDISEIIRRLDGITEVASQLKILAEKQEECDRYGTC